MQNMKSSKAKPSSIHRSRLNEVIHVMFERDCAWAYVDTASSCRLAKICGNYAIEASSNLSRKSNLVMVTTFGWKSGLRDQGK